MTRISRTFCMLILFTLGLSACGASSSEGGGNNNGGGTQPPPADNKLAWDEGNLDEENWQ